jgi:hypothetical protein
VIVDEELRVHLAQRQRMPSWWLFYGGVKRGVEPSFLGLFGLFFDSCRRADPSRALGGLRQIHREFVNRPFQFQKRSQYFFGTHDETLSVAMRVHNPNCAPTFVAC